MAEGFNTTASSYGSHAEGFGTTASGTYSHAEGTNTTASSDYSHAEGLSTTASSNGSHAEGFVTTASSNGSHAEGYHTTASGDYSHAEGDSTTASGPKSHAGGYCTVAGYSGQTVIGKYNSNKSNTAFEIGNGYDEDRSNALTVDWQGNVVASGSLTLNGDEAVADWVTEQGTKGSWKYRKWHSGKVEAWIRTLVQLPSQRLRYHMAVIVRRVLRSQFQAEYLQLPRLRSELNPIRKVVGSRTLWRQARLQSVRI